jgi:hypothetical protein
MKTTLEKYIDPENIPRKYGGTLDYKFGDMPMLEPAILSVLESTAPGFTTFPTGPVKWHVSEPGKLDAIAVGSVDGKKRRDVVAKMKTEWTDTHGISRNTKVDWTKEPTIPEDGTATQPAEGDPELGKDLGSGDATPAVVSTPPPAPASSDLPPPEKKIVEPIPGDKAVVVNTTTLGSAPKDTGVVMTAEEEEESKEPEASSSGGGVLATASGAVGSAYGAAGSVVGGVLGAVGLGWGGKKAEESEEVKKMGELKIDDETKKV